MSLTTVKNGPHTPTAKSVDGSSRSFVGCTGSGGSGFQRFCKDVTFECVVQCLYPRMATIPLSEYVNTGMILVS